MIRFTEKERELLEDIDDTPCLIEMKKFFLQFPKRQSYDVPLLYRYQHDYSCKLLHALCKYKHVSYLFLYACIHNHIPMIDFLFQHTYFRSKHILLNMLQGLVTHQCVYMYPYEKIMSTNLITPYELSSYVKKLWMRNLPHSSDFIEFILRFPIAHKKEYLYQYQDIIESILAYENNERIQELWESWKEKEEEEEE